MGGGIWWYSKKYCCGVFHGSLCPFFLCLHYYRTMLIRNILYFKDPVNHSIHIWNSCCNVYDLSHSSIGIYCINDYVHVIIRLSHFIVWVIPHCGNHLFLVHCVYTHWSLKKPMNFDKTNNLWTGCQQEYLSKIFF